MYKYIIYSCFKCNNNSVRTRIIILQFLLSFPRRLHKSRSIVQLNRLIAYRSVCCIFTVFLQLIQLKQIANQNEKVRKVTHQLSKPWWQKSRYQWWNRHLWHCILDRTSYERNMSTLFLNLLIINIVLIYSSHPLINLIRVIMIL